MLETIVETMNDAYRQWLAGMGFSERPEQLRMMRSIASALLRVDGSPPLSAIEAPSGTGKTVAYLHAAIPLARALGKQVVVSTSTITLQEQLMHKDLPSLCEHSGLAFDYALVKGRRRYLCRARFEQNAGLDDAAPQGDFDLEKSPPAAGTRTLYRELRAALDSGEWDGDRDHWPGNTAMPERDWLAVTSSSAECPGHRCGHFQDCCLYAARQQASHVLCRITNHDLLLADLMLGGGVLLPAPEQTIYIIDEAHRLGDKLCNSMSCHVGLETSAQWIDSCDAYLGRCSEQPLSGVALASDLQQKLAQAGTHLASLRQTLTALRTQLAKQLRANRSVVVLEQIAPELAALAKRASSHYSHMAELLGAARDACGAAVANARGAAAEIERRYRELGNLLSHAETAQALWHRYAEADEEDQPPWARWLQWEGSSLAQISAAPVRGGQLLRNQLWSRCAGAALSAATLTALGRFDLLCAQTGLPTDSAFDCLPQVFDHQRAASLHIPQRGFDPREAARHSREVSVLLARLLPQQSGGSLVLCASHHQLTELVAALPSPLRALALVQGEGLSRSQLLVQHRQAVDAGRRSVLFGLASFAEGVDLPGDYCRLVVLTKLPFAPPDDPITQTLSRWIERSGGSSFEEVALPEASRRLVQACGRLLRAEDDSGRIACLDSRLHTSTYGARLLATLPPYRLATLEALWA